MVSECSPGSVIDVPIVYGLPFNSKEMPSPVMFGMYPDSKNAPFCKSDIIGAIVKLVVSIKPFTPVMISV